MYRPRTHLVPPLYREEQALHALHRPRHPRSGLQVNGLMNAGQGLPPVCLGRPCPKRSSTALPPSFGGFCQLSQQQPRYRQVSDDMKLAGVIEFRHTANSLSKAAWRRVFGARADGTLCGVDREHLPRRVSGHAVGHKSREMRPKPIQLRCRPAMGCPTTVDFVPAAPGTARSRKPRRHLAEKHSNPMAPVVLHAANLSTASAIRPPNGAAPGLCGNDLLLAGLTTGASPRPGSDPNWRHRRDCPVG
jgi:hypothetical protein